MTKWPSLMVLVLLAVVVGGGWLWADGERSARQTTGRAAGTASFGGRPITSGSPPADPSYRPNRSLAEAVPNEAFLTGGETGTEGWTAPDAVMPPNLCDVFYNPYGGSIAPGFPSDRALMIPFRHMEFGSVVQSVAAYRSDGAEAFLREYLAYADGCAHVSAGKKRCENRVLAPAPLGDETLLVQRRCKDVSEAAPRANDTVAVTRVANKVSVLWVSRDREAELTRLTTQATDRLKAWR